VQADSYASAFARLASGQVDVMVTYADARLDNEEKWQEQLGGSDEIWQEVQVIGVTKPMMNDTISVSKNSENMTPELAEALQE
ncbi:PhnD/SsuA/transferrin family substrate-binding protein, partial [Actinotignum timonense]